MEERLSAPWSPLEAVPVAIGIVLATLVVSVVATAALGGPGGATILIGQFAFDAAIFGVTWAWVALRYPGGSRDLRLGSRRPGRDAALGGVAGILLFLLVGFGLLSLVVFLWEAVAGGPPPRIEQIPRSFELTPVNVAFGVVLVVVAAPIAEEVFFRGFLYTSLRSRFGILPSGAISSVVFGLFHSTAEQGVVLLVPLLFVVGMGFALVYEWRRSLVASIAAHAAFNAIGYVFIMAERGLA